MNSQLNGPTGIIGDSLGIYSNWRLAKKAFWDEMATITEIGQYKIWTMCKIHMYDVLMVEWLRLYIVAKRKNPNYFKYDQELCLYFTMYAWAFWSGFIVGVTAVDFY